MIKVNIGLCLGLTLFASGCATSLQPGAEKIKVGKSDPAPQCVELGTIYSDAYTGDPDSLRNKLKNGALNKGGNYVRMDTSGVTPNGIQTQTGTIFKCP